MSTSPTQLASFWLPGQSIRLDASMDGGKNNKTRVLEAGGTRYVLRVYETHRDEVKPAFEHAVLLALAELRLPLRTPVPLRTADGATFVRVPEGPDAGKLAALFSYTEGVTPSLDGPAQLESFGRAGGLLLQALRKLCIELQPVYRPYYEIEYTHPLCPPERVDAFCFAPPEPFRELAPELALVGSKLNAIRTALPALRRLPHQLVHGDLNASNTLAAEASGEIVAVLDFEFVTRDLRAMEIAVCLSDSLSPDHEPAALWEHAEALLRGFGDYVRLQPEETEALPMLVLLRRLDVFVHFLGRYWDHVDTADMVAEQVRCAVNHIRWLDENEQKLRHICSRRLHFTT